VSEPVTAGIGSAADPLSLRVRSAIDGLTDRPVDEHVAVLEQVNREIADELAALDEV